jgi:hypothetical protein
MQFSVTTNVIRFPKGLQPPLPQGAERTDYVLCHGRCKPVNFRDY